MATSLFHITLQTGHRRSTPRHEVGSEVLEILAPLLKRALEGQHVGVPQLPGYTWSGASVGRCCVVTLWAQTSTTLGTPAARASGPGRVSRQLREHLQIGGWTRTNQVVEQTEIERIRI